MTDLSDHKLGQYQIIEPIRKGYMSDVYRALQAGLNRAVAIKVLSAIDSDASTFYARFQREAQAVAQLQHPNILPVFDFGQEHGYNYIVMPYVKGARTLRERMNEGLTMEEIVHFVDQIAAALDHAHQRGITHRDVKPSNVMIDGDWALLTDFGLAKITAALTRITCTGVCVGTLAYMAPEQSRGLAVDFHADIYSLGVVVYEMLTGQVPHNADTAFATLFKRAMEAPQSPRAINPDIPPAVDRVVLTALAADPAQRFTSAGEFAGALKAAAFSGQAQRTLDSPSDLVTSSALGRHFRLPHLGVRTWLRRFAMVVLGVAILIVPIKVGVSVGSVNRHQDEAAAIALPDSLPSATATVTLSPPTATPSPQPTSFPEDGVDLPAMTILYKTADDLGESLHATHLPERNTYLLAAGADGLSAVLSPDGEHVVIRARNGRHFDLTLTNADGSHKVVLAAGVDDGFAQFSPDGSRLHVVWNNGGSWDAALMNADGSNRRYLARDVEDYSATWDIPWNLAAISLKQNGRYKLYLTDGQGDNRHFVTFGNNAAYSYYPEVAPDGSYILYRTYEGEELFSVYLASADGQEKLRLANEAVFPRAQFSPSGKRILLKYMTGVDLPYDLHLLDLSSGRTEMLLSGDQVEASFSPDERWITACVRRKGMYHLYVVSADGSKRRLIFGPSEHAGWAGFSPDGQWALASAFQDGHYFLYLVSADGKERREIVGADAGADAGVAGTFSLDGQSVLVRLDFSSPAGSSLRLHAVDGRSEVLLANRVQRGAYAAFTADGQHIVFDTREGDAGTICLADVNGENVRQLAQGYAPQLAQTSAPAVVAADGDTAEVRAAQALSMETR